MKFVLEKGFASSLQWKDFNFPVKDRVDSQRLRNQGNQVYQKNKLVEALELYTQSICLAPHPPPSPNTFVFQVNNNTAGNEDSFNTQVLRGNELFSGHRVCTNDRFSVQGDNF